MLYRVLLLFLCLHFIQTKSVRKSLVYLQGLLYMQKALASLKVYTSPTSVTSSVFHTSLRSALETCSVQWSAFQYETRRCIVAQSGEWHLHKCMSLWWWGGEFKSDFDISDGLHTLVTLADMVDNSSTFCDKLSGPHQVFLVVSWICFLWQHYVSLSLMGFFDLLQSLSALRDY